MSDAARGSDDDRLAPLLDELARLRRRIDSQSRLLEEQQVQIRQLEQAVDDPSGALRVAVPGSTTRDATGTPKVGRRAMLRLAGASAAGAAVAGVANITNASPAAAATGANLQLGFPNTSENPTQLLYDNAGTLNTSAVIAASDTNDFTSGFPSAIAGFSNGAKFNYGVYGWSSAGYGVVARGVSSAAAGLYAEGATPGRNGINAVAYQDGFAVDATNSTGVAVFGQGLIGLASAAAGANLRTFGLGLVPQQRTSAALAGDVASDINKDLWYAVADGTPGKWRKIAGPGTVGALHVLATPVRVYDSRPFPPNTGTKGTLGAGQSRAVSCTYGGAAPAGATAVLVNLTVISASQVGFLSAFRTGISFPGTSSVNWDHNGETVANTTVVAVDANTSLTVFVSNPVDFIVDVIGYYQ